MKQFIDKLIERLEEKFKYNSEQAEIWRDGSDKDAYFRGQKDLYMDRANTYGEVMRIVNQLAEEYKDKYVMRETLNQYMWERDIAVSQLRDLGYGFGEKVGWIPCSERLPELNEELFSDDLLVSFKDSNDFKIAFYDGNKNKWYLRSSVPYIGEVLAWQTLPPAYQPKGE